MLLVASGLVSSVHLRLLGSNIASTIALLPAGIGTRRQAHRTAGYAHCLALCHLMILIRIVGILLGTTSSLLKQPTGGNGLIHCRYILLLRICGLAGSQGRTSNDVATSFIIEIASHRHLKLLLHHVLLLLLMMSSSSSSACRSVVI